MEKKEEFVSYYGKLNEWRVFRMSDGYLVGYRSRVDANGDKTSLDRVVTTTKDAAGFGSFVDKHAQKAARYDPYKDERQTRIDVPVTPRVK